MLVEHEANVETQSTRTRRANDAQATIRREGVLKAFDGLAEEAG
jgi:hypothetical protein